VASSFFYNSPRLAPPALHHGLVLSCTSGTKESILLETTLQNGSLECILYRRYNSILAHGAAPEAQAVGKYRKKDEATAVAAIKETS